MALVWFWLTISAMLFLSFLIEKRLAQHFPYKIFRLLLFPGLFFHELSHAIVAVWFGAKITKINLFTQNGGSVHFKMKQKSEIANFLIAFAPFLFGIGIFWLLGKAFQIEFTNSPFNLTQILLSINWLSGWNWLLLWILISISATLSPSKQDFTHGKTGLLAIFLATIILFLVWPESELFFVPVVKVLIFAITINLFFLVLLEILIFLKKALQFKK